MNTYCKIFILWILLSLCAYGQEIKFEHLTRKDGLSQSTVYAILQDNKGFMWFGTQDGLNKYDGYKFTHYRHEPNNPNSLAGNFITFIYEDKAENLWIGINDAGIAKYNRQQDNFTHYRHDPKNPNSLSSDGVLSIYEDKTGSLWITTYDAGLNRFDHEQFTHYRHDPNNSNSLSSDALWRIQADATGILWIGTDSSGLNSFDPNSNKFTHYQHNPDNPNSLSSDSITDIYPDHNGNLWIGTMDAGLNKLQNNQFIRYEHDPQNPTGLNNNTIWAIHADTANNLWIATDNGLNQYLPTQNKFLQHIHDPNNPRSLSNDYVMSIYQDQAGALWVGTDGGSLNKFDQYRDKFTHYHNDPQNPNSLSHNTVSSIYANRNGILWVGTLGGGLNKFDAGTITHYKNEPDNPNSLSRDDVWSVYQDQAGILWIGTLGGGLNRFDGKNFTHYLANPDIPNSLSDDKVRAIYEDRAGNLWLGTRDGLNKFDRKQFTHYKNDPNNPNSISENSVLSIYEDFAGMLWIGTQGGGLNQFNPKTETFTAYLHDPNDAKSISHNDVFAVYEDSEYRLWVGTQGGGLNQFNRKSQIFTHYRQADGLANDVTYGILEDKSGNLWISTNGGLSKFNPANNTFRNYDVLDGLQSDEFREAYYQNQQEFLFGGINGFNVFNPEQIKDNPYVPPVVITDFKIFNRSVVSGDNSPLKQQINAAKTIVLTYQQSFFSFEFAALNFLQPEKNQYAYQLEGLEQEWNFSGTRRNAYYTSVPSGVYNFRVRGSNNDGIWNEVGTAIKITVLPPLWQTWWAYTFYIITILAIIFSYMQLQQRKLQAKQQELEREQQIAIQLKATDRLKDEFLANTSHELRTPLNGIIGIAESLIDGAAGSINQQLEANLAIIVSSGRRLTNLVNDILDYSKLKKHEFDLQRTAIDMRTIVEVVLTLSQPLIGQKSIKLINNISTDLPSFPADENRIQQILHNLVGNAIKFTDNGKVTVSAAIVAEGFSVTVADTGIGIPAEKLSRIFEAFEQVDGSTARIYGGTGLGLAVTHQLVNLHGGQLCVESGLSQGSKFTFILPITEQQVTNEPRPIITKQSEDLILPILQEKSPDKFSEENILELVSSQEGEYTVLIVDDEPVNRQVLVNHLSLQNYNIIQAESGIHALELLEKIEPPDIILLDVMMPIKSGYEVTKEIRQTWAANELPIILLTAKNQTADLVLGLQSGANDYLTKPVFKDELIVRIKTHLNISKLKAETLRLAIENKNRLMQFLESMTIGVVVLDIYTSIFFINQKAQLILGLKPLETITIPNIEQLVDVCPFYLTGTKKLYPYTQLPFISALGGEIANIDDVEINKNGVIVPLEILGTPIFAEDGNIISAITTLQDITERKRLEIEQCQFTQKLTNYSETLEQQVTERTEKLRQSEKLLEDAQRMALVGSWIWDIKTGTVSRSAQDCLNYQLDPENYIPSYEAFIERVHPEDKEIIDSLLETCIIDEEAAEIEFRLVWSDGQIRTLRSRAELEYDDFDTPIYLKGFSQDITDSKRIEEKVKQQNIELQNTNSELEILTKKLAEAQQEKLYKLNQAYERFVPKEFLNLLEKASVIEVNLGDHIEMDITVLFSDIRGFTAISETMTPKEVFDYINIYLGQMEPIITENKGIIDKYIGDAIMAIFPDCADNAVQGGIAMLNTLSQYNELLVRAGLEPMEIGIGLNSGLAMLGTIGGQNRMDGTVISDTVNVASRVEGLTKIYGTPLLITEQTYLELTDPLQYHIRVIDAVQVKGKSEVVTVYEIYDADSATSLSLKDQTRDDFEEGFVLYHWEEYKDAKPFFERVLAVNQDDLAAQIYLTRCDEKIYLEVNIL